MGESGQTRFMFLTSIKGSTWHSSVWGQIRSYLARGQPCRCSQTARNCDPARRVGFVRCRPG